MGPRILDDSRFVETENLVIAICGPSTKCRINIAFASIY